MYKTYAYTWNKRKRKESTGKNHKSCIFKKKKDEILFEIDNKKIKSEKQIRALKFIQKNEGLTIPEIEMHTDCSRAIINTLIKKWIFRIS